MTPPVPDGTADLTVTHYANATPTVLVGGVPAQVQFAGQAPGFPGVNQINIVIPNGAPPGNAVSLQVQTADGKIISTPGATIAIGSGSSPGQQTLLQDTFAKDTALNAALWATDTSLLKAVANAFGEGWVEPKISFSGSGMTMSGVMGAYQFTGVQSQQGFSPPFTMQVTATGTVANGNPFWLDLTSGDTSQYVYISGNLNPANGPYYSINLGSSDPNYPSGVVLDASPSVNVWYTMTLAVDATGKASVTLADTATGAMLGSQSAINLGHGPFYLILGQYEGLPYTLGPNTAVWGQAQVVTSGTGASNPIPAITSLSPSSAQVGAAPVTLNINGTGFIGSSAVTFNGVSHTVTLVSASQLAITLTTSDLSTAGSYPVVVTNPSPGGGISNSAAFTVQPGTSTGSSIIINVTGLPNGVNSLITVRGPGGYQNQVIASSTLTGLTSGAYSVSVGIVPAPSGTSVYIPSISGSGGAITISGNQTATVNVNYNGVTTVWKAIGPTNIPLGANPAAGKLQAFATSNVNPLVMYAGGGLGPGNSGPDTEAGVYTTANGGKTWTQANVGLTDPTVDALWLDQSNPQVLLAGTWFSGIFRSVDGGAHWSPTATCSATAALGATTAFLQSGSTLFAATAQGVAQSSDDGATWCIMERTNSPVRALTGTSGMLYAGLEDGHVLVGSGSGASWTVTQPSTSPATVWSLAVDPTNPQVCWAVEWNNYSSPDLYITRNGGQGWTLGPTLGQLGVQFVVIEPSNPRIIFAGADESLYKSTDGGNTWAQVSSASIWDVRLIVADAGGIAGHIVIGSDQGLFASNDNGVTWSSLNGNITSNILYTISVAGKTILTGAQDFSAIASFDGGGTWQLSAPGEGGAGLINPGNNSYAYAFTVAGFQYSSDGGHSFVPVSVLSGNRIPITSPNLIAVDLKVPSIVYVAANDGVYRSADFGRTFSREAWSLPTNPTLVVVDPSNSQTIFVGLQGNGGVYVTHDSGSTWAQANLNGAAGTPVVLAIDPSNSQNVLLGTSALPPQGGLFLSTDGGKTFNAVNTGLSSAYGLAYGSAIFAVGVYQGTPGILAAATWSGLYLSSDMGVHWTNIRGNAIPYLFTDVTWSGGCMYATTFGEGVLELPFTQGCPQVTSVSQVTAQPQPSITITGSGFGSFPNSLPYKGDSDYLEISNITKGWNSGLTGDVCDVTVNQWSATSISLMANVNQNGTLSACGLATGDVLLIKVWNPQTLAGPGSITITVQ